MVTQTPPQFSPAGGEGSTYGGFTFSGGNWVPTTQPQSQTQNQGWYGQGGNFNQGFSGQAPTNQIISTGSKPKKEFAKNSQAVTQMISSNSATPMQPYQQGQDQKDMFKFMNTYSDPYTQMLDRISAKSDQATKNLISTIQAQKANRANTVNQEADRLKQGLMSLGVSTGNVEFTPDLVYGNIAQAENARMSKLQELDRDEATALLEATQASEEKDFKLLRERMDYIKSIKKSRLDLLKESSDILSYENKIGEQQATRIYDELQKLPEAQKLQFLQQVATQFDIPLTALTSQVNEITRDRTKASGTGSGKKLSLKEIQSFKEDHPDVADQITYGMTEQEVADLIEGGSDEEPGGDGFTIEVDRKVRKVLRDDLGFSRAEARQFGRDVEEFGLESVLEGLDNSMAARIREALQGFAQE